LDNSQLKHSIKDKDQYGQMNDDFQQRYNDNNNQSQNNGQYGVQEGEQVDQDGRVTRGPVTLKNGAIYTGNWLNGVRDGLGSQMWPDGSRYEGHWKGDKANGQGKLVHADGDIYEG